MEGEVGVEVGVCVMCVRLCRVYVLAVRVYVIQRSSVVFQEVFTRLWFFQSRQVDVLLLKPSHGF